MAVALNSGTVWAQSGSDDADLGDFANVSAGDAAVAVVGSATPYPVGATVRYLGPAGSNATGDDSASSP